MSDAAGPEDGVGVLRSRMRADLVAAMKAHRPEVVAALRTAIAALDNAEAVAPAAARTEAASEHLAGTTAGVGSTEAERHRLTLDDVRAVLRAQVAERGADADRYDAHGQHEAAGRLRREAEALARYTHALPPGG
ncbi:MAG TPA: hypothetical protein VIB11_10245 [Pedococcus sp.]|jgi:hypothetical protein|uniref:hypothetical protein n=1 Tax=Pedococcus sp. TaxID=2860345 RepID=UPI002F93995D